MANKKAHIKRERIPSYTFIKEFDDFDEGYSHMISLIPDIAMYGGENTTYDSVVNSLLNTISESIPSPKNSNFPNTMSLSINSKEVGFLTDDQMAFGWKIFLQKNNDSLAFQFRITFLSLSISKKKSIDVLMENGWKEKDLSDKQSRFWNEIHTNSRPSYKDAPTNKQSSNKQPEKRQVVQEVPVKDDRDELVEVMFPGTNQKVWIKKKDLGNKYPPSKMEIEIQKNDYPEPIKESETTIVEENEITSPITAIAENVQQPSSQPVKQNNTEQIVVTTNKNNSIGQQVKIIDESKTEYAEPSRDISNCAIYPYEGKATFRIEHFGNEFIYNINDRQDGIFVDRNSRTIKIDNVLYNYQSFKVLQLDEDFDNQSSTYVPGIQNKMREHGPLDDSVFVPRSIIEKANNPDLSYSETVVVAKKKQEAEAKQNKMLFAQQQPQQSFNTMTMPKMSNNGKPALVLNTKPVTANQNTQTGMAQQTVRISDNRTH